MILKGILLYLTILFYIVVFLSLPSMIEQDLYAFMCYCLLMCCITYWICYNNISKREFVKLCKFRFK